MRYSQLETRKASEFQRLTGVKPEVFGQMLDSIQSQTRAFGRPCKLSLPDQLLLCLMDWREYRTMAHIAVSYEVSEPTVHRTIRKIETALLSSGAFTLPGKKILRGDQICLEVVLVDATEVPIERPQGQKNSVCATPARRNVIR
jgi:hypothetical protein